MLAGKAREKRQVDPLWPMYKDLIRLRSLLGKFFFSDHLHGGAPTDPVIQATNILRT